MIINWYIKVYVYTNMYYITDSHFVLTWLLEFMFYIGCLNINNSDVSNNSNNLVTIIVITGILSTNTYIYALSVSIMMLNSKFY